jgi:hypothetical protein
LRAAIAAAVLFCSSSSRAQPAVHNSSRSELLRVLVAEARWDAPRSHAAMLHVLQRHAERNNISLIESANRTIWPFSNAQYDHPWTRYLNESCEQPDYYRGNWLTEKCLRIVQLIQLFQEGRVSDPCKGAPTGWRSPRSRALRYALHHGFVRVRCVGGTSLAFVRPKGHGDADTKKAKGHPKGRGAAKAAFATTKRTRVRP